MASRGHQPSVNSFDSTMDICEVFYSIAGESSKSGTPALFVRLSGCNLRCKWCDTKKSWAKGTQVPLNRLIKALEKRDTRLVVLTGGEPLLQPSVIGFCRDLLAGGKTVQVETNGSRDISILPDGVQVVMDMKPPSSGEQHKMDLDNIRRLRPGDDLKMVIANRDDFLWALGFLEKHPPISGINVFLSPAGGRVKDETLARWILDAGIDARMQIQLHRVLWPDGDDGQALDEFRQISKHCS